MDEGTKAEFEAACAVAADAQGLTPLIERLTAVGVEHTVEQTGGMVMVVLIPVGDGQTLGVTVSYDDEIESRYYVVRYSDWDSGEDEGVELRLDAPPDEVIAIAHAMRAKASDPPGTVTVNRGTI